MFFMNALTANSKASKYVEKKYVNNINKQIKEACEKGHLHLVVNFSFEEDEISIDELRIIKKYFINRHYQVSFVAGDKYATMDIDWENV